MAMTDPIADMLTRIRNGLSAGHQETDVPASRMKEEICAVLKREGYIDDYERVPDGKQGLLRITLRYEADRTPVIRGVRRVSKPSLRIHVGSGKIMPVRSGLGISILSTSSGIMTGRQARKANLGGEVICNVW